ncbi:MAG TPA: LLM class F420-dependent oxidoreductase [Acidimicrobiia bacterium]|jgi:F420-dependent oxidoreductase-like protein|nr:LLM class F420-dependent oxidoreductase [Acidimicrobiia bacterium]
MTLALRIFVEPQQGASYDIQLAVAREAERLGFDAFFRSDHYRRMGGDPAGPEARPGPTDSWVTLAGLARETSTIRLGTLVTSATFRLPGPLAIAVAEVDAMSGGRVELGLGSGWFEAEHTAYGIPFPPLGERFDRLEEQLAIITGLWTTPEGKHFDFDGRHYQLKDSPALPKPVQDPRPPIIVGGGGTRRTPALAARHAAEFNLAFRPLEEFTAACDRVRAACGAISRDPATMIFSAALVLCCGADEAEFTRRAAAIGRDPAELRASGACGTPDEVAARLLEWHAAGAARIYLQTLDLADLDHLRLVADEVAPRLL